jgi:hypothetical protein
MELISLADVMYFSNFYQDLQRFRGNRGREIPHPHILPQQHGGLPGIKVGW